MRSTRIFVTAAVVVVAVSCTSSGESGPEETSSTVVSPEEAIDRFDESQNALASSIARLNESAAADPDAMRSAALAGLDATGSSRFAAVYALSLTASTADQASMDALRDLAASADVTERLFSAGTLAALGEKDAVLILIEGLSSDEPVRNVDPPMAAWRYARANLLSLVAQDLGLRDAADAGAAATAGSEWRTWWQGNGDALTWNAELGRYEG